MTSSTKTALSSELLRWLPSVKLHARGTTYTMEAVDFVIGVIPGCDLRVGGDVVPPSIKGRAGDAGVCCIISRHPGGVSIRKLPAAPSIRVNGASITDGALSDGDRVQIGALEIMVSIAPPASVPPPAPTAPAPRAPAPPLAASVPPPAPVAPPVEIAPPPIAASAPPPERAPDDTPAERELEFERQKRELAKVRGELNDLRKQLYDHYQDRRDRLATMQEDLDKTRVDLDERERKLRLDEQDFLSVRTRERQRQDDLERRSADILLGGQRLEDERRQFEARQQEAIAEWDRKLAELEAREKVVVDEHVQTRTRVQTYEADIVRLHRQQGEMEKREADLNAGLAELAKSKEEIREATSLCEEQLVQVDQWRAKAADDVERLAAQKIEQDQRNRELDERAASIEGQQSSLAILRNRLERMRDQMRDEQQRLDEQRAQQEAATSEFAEKQAGFATLQAELDADRQQYERDRTQWLERSAVLETAVRQLKTTEASLAAREVNLQASAHGLQERERMLEEANAVLQGRLQQVAEAQERVDLERQNLRERSMTIIEREEACRSLQEQLHRRTEEIASHQKEITDRLQEYQAKFAELDDRSQQLDAREKEQAIRFEASRIELDQKAQQIQTQNVQLSEAQVAEVNQLAVQRQAHARERAEFQLEQQAALEKFAQARAELESMRRDAITLIEQLPDAETRAGGVIDRLSNAREQLRNHLSEVHQYVRQCQDEMTELRNRLQGDLDKLTTQEESLRRNQDEHRHAAVAFRQQLIDWQGQIAELKRLLARDESRLEKREAKVDERARAMEVEEHRLAVQAVNLVEQEREVADRREEMDRHLVDMREWYRKKLRDLAGIPLVPDTLAALTGSATDETGEPVILPVDASDPSLELTVNGDDEPAIVPTGRSILSMSAAADSGDRQLGQLLRESQLIDADTLTALLAEARRQRRSLRQVLLASGVITLYQLALIEAGNVDGLMLGPVRVIDRVRTSPHETVYRVFDPRRGVEAVLRHLAEDDAGDAVKPDEFRQRFTQAKLNDIHLANTLEVFELAGRPAVLQEWLTGLPASDWPPLAAAPGVCHRLLTQAAQGLAVAHQAGATHGHLADALLLLTGDGTLKICGLGEPPWLVGLQYDEEPTIEDDLRTLGKIVAGWCTPTGVRKGAKTKPLPEALVSILYRLTTLPSPSGRGDGGEGGTQGYQSAKDLLADLEAAASAIPPNSEAWDRLVKYVRDHGTAEALLRQSA